MVEAARTARTGSNFFVSKRIMAAFSTLALFTIGYMCLFTLTNVPKSMPSMPSFRNPLSSTPSADQPPAEASGSQKSDSSTSQKDTAAPVTGGLVLDAFNTGLQYHPGNDAFRHISNDAWRPNDAYAYTHSSPANRPKLPELSSFANKGEYMKQSIVADYANNTDKMFLMIKTGATVLWERLPMHLVTTLTRVPNFALYADVAGSVGGHEVIDVLQNVTDTTKESNQFKMYRRLHHLRQSHGTISASETTLNGGWDLDKFKNLPMLLHAWKTSPDSEWFVFMDADTYFMIDNLMDYLSTLDPEDPLYLGSSAMLGDTLFAHGGSGVVLSRKAMQLTFGDHPEWVTESEGHAMQVCCGDYMVAWLMQKADIHVSGGYDYPYVGYKFQGNTYQSLRINKDVWCEKVVSFHHLEPNDIEVLWEYERLLGPERRKNIRYGDIYRDFVAPYIREEMFEWDNTAQQKEYSAREDADILKGRPETELPEPRPWKNVDACKAACETKKSCLMWRYLPREEICAIENNVRLGQPFFQWIKSGDPRDRTDITSGYMIKRIRKLRQTELKCDSIFEKSSEELENDHLKEGWYVRLQHEEKERARAKAAVEAEKKEKEKADKNVVQDESQVKAEHEKEQEEAKKEGNKQVEANKKEEEIDAKKTIVDTSKEGKKEEPKKEE